MPYRGHVFKACVSLFIFIICIISLSANASECDDLEKDLNKKKLDLGSLYQSRLVLENLLNARLSMSQSVYSVLGFTLDNEYQIGQERGGLERQQKQLENEPSLPKAWTICAKQDGWLALVKENRKEQQALLKAKKMLLTLPRDTRALLARTLEAWSLVRLSYVDMRSKSSAEPAGLVGTTDSVTTIASTSTSGSTNSGLNSESTLVDENDRDEFLAQALAYKIQLEDFIAHLYNKELHPQDVNQYWLNTQDDYTKLLDVSVEPLTELDVGFLTLHQAKHSLLSIVSEWRNQVMVNAGWLVFFDELLSPASFIDGLLYELTSAPQNFLDNLSNPFIREYLISEKESKGAQLLTSWTIQFAFLLLMIFILVKLAANTAAWLSEIQQALLKKLENATSHPLVSGIFWVLKPNASWVFILVVANLVSMTFPDNWRVIKLIAPLATIYAGFRAFRIIIEWGLSRTYTRGGMFLSNLTAEQLILDSRKMTWVLVYASVLWALVYATGGAYLIYVLCILYVVALWCGAWWVLRKHEVAVNKLIQFVLKVKPADKREEQSRLLAWLYKLAWPLLFVVAHVLDVLANLNQKMMVFDVYRSFSVKLLRVRLESKSEENIEEDEGEPDQNYSDWMLREAPEGLLLDIGDVSTLIEPLKNWFLDKTDENVMVIVGEAGSGKSTLVRRLPTLWEDTPIKVLNVPPKLTDSQSLFDSIAQVLGIESFTDIGGLVRQDAEIEQQVIVIDSAHNLFLAEVGLFDAYKSLLQCINAHLENVFWVVVMHSPSWTYLNYVFVREQRISNIYKMPRWSPMDIRKLILSRHQGGRRRLKYNEMLLSAAASSESSSVRAADSRVFNILWEQCGGNPLAAIELWLYAVKVKGRVAEVGVPQRPSTNLLNGLKDDLYFVYTAIVQHFSLSTDEIMQVTHFSEPVVRHALKQGINLGMIKRDETKRYTVDPYWYGTLSGFLHRKNMLWG